MSQFHGSGPEFWQGRGLQSNLATILLGLSMAFLKGYWPLRVGRGLEGHSFKGFGLIGLLKKGHLEDRG